MLSQQNLDQIKDWSIIAAGAIALTTFWSGMVQYSRQNHAKRAEQFVQMRRRFLEDPLFREILNYLATDDERLCQVSIQDRRNFIGFLEEVALMVNSRMIRPQIARYMFGYYVSLADQSRHIWHNLDKESEYWTVFRDYARQLNKQAGTKAASLPSTDLKF